MSREGPNQNSCYTGEVQFDNMASSRTSVPTDGCLLDTSSDSIVPSDHDSDCSESSSDGVSIPLGLSSEQQEYSDLDIDMNVPSDAESSPESINMDLDADIELHGPEHDPLPLAALFGAIYSAESQHAGAQHHPLLQHIFNESFFTGSNTSQLPTVHNHTHYYDDLGDEVQQHNSEHSDTSDEDNAMLLSNDHGGAPILNQEVTNDPTIGSMLNDLASNTPESGATDDNDNVYDHDSENHHAHHDSDSSYTSQPGDEPTETEEQEQEQSLSGPPNAGQTTQTTQTTGQNVTNWPNILGLLNNGTVLMPHTMMPPFHGTNSAIGVGTENAGLSLFMDTWSGSSRRSRPDRTMAFHQLSRRVKMIRKDLLDGDRFDLQGLNWSDMGTTRKAARKMRGNTYKNYVNCLGSDNWESLPLEKRPRRIRSSEDFLLFDHMNVRSDAHLAHFQLRSLLASPSSSKVLYATRLGINMADLNRNRVKSFMSLRQSPFDIAWERRITTLDAKNGIVMAGTFSGDYMIKSLHSSDSKEFTEGSITSGQAGITNHIQLYSPRRSSSTVAAIGSNDDTFRIFDIASQRFTQETAFPFPINRTSISPDRRLRAMVGDSLEAVVADADSGRILVELSGHRDFGFACDWSECGRYVATGFQDKSVRVWDSRKWTSSNGDGVSVANLSCNIAGARSLRFSPLGSGPPILVAAEEADFISVINGQTFDSKQQFDIFGEISGLDFSDEGRELNVLCSDPHRGGIMHFRRCEFGAVARSPELPYWDPIERAWADLDQQSSRSDWTGGRVGTQVCPRSLPAPF